MLKNFQGKTVIITGASGGIGRAVADKFAAAGASLILHANENTAALQDFLADVKTRNGSGEIVQADFSVPSERARFVDKVMAATANVDLWINAAGIDLMSARWTGTDYIERMRHLFEVDVFASIEMSREIGQRMKIRGAGTIFFFSWDGVDYGWKGDTAELYGAAKGALLGFSRSLAERLAPEVRICTLALGWIKTRWGSKASDDFDRKVALDSLAGRWGTPEEVADTVLFLSQDSASYLDTINIRLNGGKRGTKGLFGRIV